MRKWLATWFLFGSLTITIPDAKDAFVLAARDSFNTRTGQSLTTVQYVKEVLKRSVVSELMLSQTQMAQATITASNATCEAQRLASEAALQSYFETNFAGW